MKTKRYWEMNTKELVKGTKQFDEPFVADQSRALTRAEREQWNKAKRRNSVPTEREGLKRVSVSLEQGLLDRLTALAKQRRISRSLLIAQELEQALARMA